MLQWPGSKLGSPPMSGSAAGLFLAAGVPCVASLASQWGHKKVTLSPWLWSRLENGFYLWHVPKLSMQWRKWLLGVTEPFVQ